MIERSQEKGPVSKRRQGTNFVFPIYFLFLIFNFSFFFIKVIFKGKER